MWTACAGRRAGMLSIIANVSVEFDERRVLRNLVVLSAMLGAGAGRMVGTRDVCRRWRLPSGVYLPRR